MSDALRFSRLDDIQKYGSDCALLLYNFRFWVETNYHEKRNQHEGRTWTYNSYKALTKWFPFFSESQIKRMLTKLCSEDGPLIRGNFNKNGYDKTSWYAFKNESFLKKEEQKNDSTPHETKSSDHDETKSSNRLDDINEPIPDLKPYGKPDSKNRAKKAPSSKLFYCYEKRKIEGLTEADILQWKEIYKSLDIEMEIKKFEVYLFDCEKKYVNLRSAITNRLSSQVRFYAANPPMSSQAKQNKELAMKVAALLKESGYENEIKIGYKFVNLNREGGELFYDINVFDFKSKLFRHYNINQG